jgi:hypothetical protein
MYGFIMSYKISDSVAMRFIQIFQEAVLMGIDGADLMRQVRLVVDPEETDTLLLDSDYKKFVEETHEKYLTDIEKKRNTDKELNIQFETTNTQT